MNLTKAAHRYVENLEQGLQRVRYSLRRQGFSYSSEQRILSKYIAELLPKDHSKTVVDIGAGNGVRWSNTYSLFLSGWGGVGIEADSRQFSRLVRAYKNLPQAHAAHCMADPANIVPLLKSLGIEKNFSVLSLDIDGNDYWVLKAILMSFRPALIVTEINEKIPPPLRFLFKYAPNSQLRHHFFGYSIAVLEDLCGQHDYGILELEYNNAFIAPKELKNARFVDAQTAYAQGYRDRPDRKERFASNLDMEVLHSLSPAEGIEFLQEFYAKESGKYYLAADRESLFQQLKVTDDERPAQ
jgi:hypothetical protein